MSRATQVAVIVAAVGTLLLGSSTAAPQTFSSRAAATADTAARALAAARAQLAARAAAPNACFANRPCPGPSATICFASAVVREPACPGPKVTYLFVQAPQGERR